MHIKPIASEYLRSIQSNQMPLIIFAFSQQFSATGIESCHTHYSENMIWMRRRRALAGFDTRPGRRTRRQTRKLVKPRHSQSSLN